MNVAFSKVFSITFYPTWIQKFISIGCTKQRVHFLKNKNEDIYFQTGLLGFLLKVTLQCWECITKINIEPSPRIAAIRS